MVYLHFCFLTITVILFTLVEEIGVWLSELKSFRVASILDVTCVECKLISVSVEGLAFNSSVYMAIIPGVEYFYAMQVFLCLYLGFSIFSYHPSQVPTVLALD